MTNQPVDSSGVTLPRNFFNEFVTARGVMQKELVACKSESKDNALAPQQLDS